MQGNDVRCTFKRAAVALRDPLGDACLTKRILASATLTRLGEEHVLADLADEVIPKVRVQLFANPARAKSAIVTRNETGTDRDCQLT